MTQRDQILEQQAQEAQDSFTDCPVEREAYQQEAEQ